MNSGIRRYIVKTFGLQNIGKLSDLDKNILLIPKIILVFIIRNTTVVRSLTPN